MPKLHLKQPGFTDKAYGLFTKTVKELKKKKNREAGNLKHLYRNELDKSCFGQSLFCFSLVQRITTSNKFPSFLLLFSYSCF